jgi:acetyltransferase-like isoleucine patch superfamily enzyme
MGRLRRGLRHLLSGSIVGVVYEKVFLYAVPETLGVFSLWYYRAIYRGFSFGAGIKCWGRIFVTKSPHSRIRFGNGVRLGSDFARAGIALYSRCKFIVSGQGRIEIGDRAALSGTSITCRSTSVTIGPGTMIAPNVIIVDSDFHARWPPDDRTNSAPLTEEAVIIGPNVWRGMNTLVLKGVTIGENSIIAAGSVIVRDIPANVVAAGNPAKVVRPLESADGSTG